MTEPRHGRAQKALNPYITFTHWMHLAVLENLGTITYWNPGGVQFGGFMYHVQSYYYYWREFASHKTMNAVP